jgi:hypothetical protein
MQRQHTGPADGTAAAAVARLPGAAEGGCSSSGSGAGSAVPAPSAAAAALSSSSSSSSARGQALPEGGVPGLADTAGSGGVDAGGSGYSSCCSGAGAPAAACIADSDVAAAAPAPPPSKRPRRRSVKHPSAAAPALPLLEVTNEAMGWPGPGGHRTPRCCICDGAPAFASWGDAQAHQLEDTRWSRLTP